MPIMNAILSMQSTEQDQGEVMGLSSSALSISNAIGPAIAGLLVTISYGTPFYVSGILTLFTAGFAFSFRSLLTPSR